MDAAHLKLIRIIESTSNYEQQKREAFLQKLEKIIDLYSNLEKTKRNIDFTDYKTTYILAGLGTAVLSAYIGSKYM